jgi:hypothetical protein
MADLENPDETTPLVASVIDREPPPLKDIKEHTFKETLVGAAALIGRKLWHVVFVVVVIIMDPFWIWFCSCHDIDENRESPISKMTLRFGGMYLVLLRSCLTLFRSHLEIHKCILFLGLPYDSHSMLSII